MKEVWRDIYFEEDGIVWDYRGLYAVSNLGKVKSLGNDKTRKEKILQPRKNTKGYLRVGLCKNGKVKRFRVHRLVLFMFNPDGYFGNAEVDHINTIRTDNRVENLRWVTHKENQNNILSRANNSKAKTAENHPMWNKGVMIAQYDKETNKLIKVWNSSANI